MRNAEVAQDPEACLLRHDPWRSSSSAAAIDSSVVPPSLGYQTGSTEPGEMRLTGFGRRLLQDTDGQVLLFGVVMFVAVLVFVLVIPNGTHVTTQKVRAQNAADAGAFTGSVWLSRSLNLSANMNIGIKNVYTWITVLTMGEALAQALYSDSLDPSVRLLGQELTLALFGSSDPVTVSYTEYPGSIRKLDTTAQWLYALQDDITESFHDVAAALGSEEASRNAGAYPPSQAAGGWAIVRTNDSIPLLVESNTGDSLLYADLLELGAALDTIPTLDPNVGPATGTITIDPTTYEIKAYYGDSSNWATLVQSLIVGQTTVNQWYDTFPNTPDSLSKIYSAQRHYIDFKDPRVDSATGKSWLVAGLPIWYIDSLKPLMPIWRCYGKKSYSVPHPGDTVWIHQRHWKLWDGDPYVGPGETAPGSLPWINDSGYSIDSSWLDPVDTDFYTGAESTTGYLGPRVRVRRVNPDREFHAVSYVWRQGASTAPFGLSPPLGGAIYRHNAVAAASPMLAVARSEPYLAISSPAEHDYYFAPAWDVRLTPLDSIGVVEITSDTAYPSHSQGCFDNLEDLREHVLLP